jgi:16S rRNA C967 or C1407 C5-methylase (RsmB/RsmF family)
MQELSNTARRLARGLFDDPAACAAFLDALATPRPYAPALVWLADRPLPLPFALAPPLEWQPAFVDRVTEDQRPGQHPWHAAGLYYCLDMSSVFTSCALLVAERQPALVIDVCSAPGGKSVFAWRLLEPRLLLCNEVIKKRTGALIANLERCRIAPALVVTMDSSRLAEACPRSAEVVLVDAPCSGQSLIARGRPSPGCFHPATINLNTNRQRRILARAAELVAPGGSLVYITCTYSAKENEDTVRWLTAKQPQFVPLTVAPLQAFQSHLADFPCYRLWPQQGIGAGGFAAILRNTDERPRQALRRERLRVVWPKGKGGPFQ